MTTKRKDVVYMETQGYAEPDYRETYRYLVPKDEHPRMARILSRDCWHCDVLCIGNPVHTYKMLSGLDVELVSMEEEAYLKADTAPDLVKWLDEGLGTYFYFGQRITLERPKRTLRAPTPEELEALAAQRAEFEEAEEYEDGDEADEISEFDWECYAKELAKGEPYFIMRYGEPAFGYCAEELNLKDDEDEIDYAEGCEEMFDYGEDEPQENTALNVSDKALFLPKEGFDRTALNNLEGLLESKGQLIKKALGIRDISYTLTGDNVIFDWLGDGASAEQVEAFHIFVTKLCELAKTQKKVTGQAKTYDNEKYAFRCFLLRLGLIGDKYRTARKELLKNLNGNAAWRRGHEKEDGEDGFLS